MKLELTNIGKIREAAIQLNGITVIAGENNTGKSTIGKMLFCTFHAFYRIEEQIREERVKSVYRALSGYYHEMNNKLISRRNTMSFAEQVVDRKAEFLENRELLFNTCREFYLSKRDHFEYTEKNIENLAGRIYLFLALDDEDIRQTILRKRLEAEFGMNVGHLNMPEKKATVKLNIKNSSIHFEISRNSDIKIKNYINLTKEIIYIDDPFILDQLMSSQWAFLLNEFEHQQDLLKKIAREKQSEEFSVVDEVLAKKKIENILESMNDVCDGDIITQEERFVYQTKQLNGNLEMVNLSTGMKSFAILRRLLQNGTIDDNGIIILDEPEIHLHPEWQLKFAQSIVLLQKEFGAHILLNTHSPYFLNAIEVYSAKYEIDNQCNYYLVDEMDGTVSVSEVTDRTEVIYEKLASPLQKLENLEYSNESTISNNRII